MYLKLWQATVLFLAVILIGLIIIAAWREYGGCEPSPCGSIVVFKLVPMR